MKIGDKLLCIKDMYNGDRKCHISGKIYSIESFLQFGKVTYKNVSTDTIQSVYVFSEPNTMVLDVVGYSINPRYDHEKLDEYFINLKKSRRLKLENIYKSKR